MSDEPDNIVLVYLRRIDATLDRVIADVQDLKPRVTALELGQSRLRSDVADLYGAYAGLQLRFGRMDSWLERIGRRFDLQEVHS